MRARALSLSVKAWQVPGPFFEVHGRGVGWLGVMIAKLLV